MPPHDPYVRSEEELAEYEAPLARPDQEALREFRRLFVEYATAQGGLTLEFWRLYRGPWFGEKLRPLRQRSREDLERLVQCRPASPGSTRRRRGG